MVSAVALAVTLALSAFGDVSQTALVVAVIVIGFVVSWIHSGRSLAPGADGDPSPDREGRPDPLSPGRTGETGIRGSDRPDGHGGQASHRVAVVPLHPGTNRRVS